MVKNSSKNNRKHVGTRVASKRKTDKYAKGAEKLGWNAKRTVRQNLEAAGLATALNDHASIIRQRGLRLNRTSASEFLAMVDEQLPASSALTAAAERNPARGKFFMKDEEVLYLQPLVAKYRDNYTAMFRDMKLNNLQHSAQHLETRCKRLLAFLEGKGQETAMEDGAGGGGSGSSSSSSSSSSAAAAGGGGGAMDAEPRQRRKSLKVIDQPNLAGDDEDWEKLAQAKLKVLSYGKLR